MIEETFASGRSFIHKTDPRCRVVAAILLCFVIALGRKIPMLWAGFGLSIILVMWARLNLVDVFKRLLAIWFFLLFLWAILPFTCQGEVIWRMGKLGITRQGIDLCTAITIKSNAVLLVFIALITTMDFSTLGYALNFFNAPKKLVHLLLLTYRYIFVIEEEHRRLVRAAKLRCFQPGTNMHTYRTYAYLCGMLFVRASARAQRVYNAMKCRGFSGRFICLHEFAISRADKIWTLAILTAAACLFFMETTL
ncbi:cobalt ECF transporter T component CbiQ [uncultured Desulfobacter sp.]|uniref:cobalt ECF transporter T component CbiQ n=1 Tax=uncultured Desulfobacter sp. TaxID=240139 RepID=UPI002AAA8E26|nr:cobalt ECF transporter T component CbiQ [uncultured Desulfobacter sp.]